PRALPPFPTRRSSDLEGGSRPSPVIPHEPMARGPGHAAPLAEPGRPPARAPYVRDDHWYGHAAPDDPRFHLEHPFQFGHFGLVGDRKSTRLNSSHVEI